MVKFGDTCVVRSLGLGPVSPLGALVPPALRAAGGSGSHYVSAWLARFSEVCLFRGALGG